MVGAPPNHRASARRGLGPIGVDMEAGNGALGRSFDGPAPSFVTLCVQGRG